MAQWQRFWRICNVSPGENFLPNGKKNGFDSHFLIKLGAFLGHFQCEDHPGHAVPDLPRPLANLWIHPCLISAEKIVPILREQNQKGFFFYILSLKDRCFLLKLGAFLGHFLCEDHLGHAVPDLPRPLANLGRHPGQRIEEKPAV